ncbi:MAG: esterase [Flavobacteriales bacterium]|nr:esterase [Flavobacteriales bacterium]
MKLFPFIQLLFCSTSILAQSALPQVVSGRIERYENFPSKFVSSRNIDVWLPEGYNDSLKYAVLYMHDGQMLFDPDQTFNHQSWNVDDVASDLLTQNKLKDFIVVGIWNSGMTRYQDYFPQKPFETLSPTERDTVVTRLIRAGRASESFQALSDNYLKFIVKELKPYIDHKYAVLTNRENTMIAGSSMGGLISLYAICEYPQVFGGAACLSTHWPAGFTLENNPFPKVILNYLNKNLPSRKKHKFYFDCGDQTLDALYPSIQRQMDDVMKAHRYTERNWLTRYFPGDDHSEKSWNKRLEIPLGFILGK